jgi:hypothetical protein
MKRAVRLFVGVALAGAVVVALLIADSRWSGDNSMTRAYESRRNVAKIEQEFVRGRASSAGSGPPITLCWHITPAARGRCCGTFGTFELVKCWHCDSEAKAICVFCGRGICSAHRKAMEHFVGYDKKTESFVDAKGAPSASAIHVSEGKLV